MIEKPVTFIINLSLQTGIVPTEWKVAKVLPLFKPGSTPEIDNYTPISILPILSKILEKKVHKQLVSHLESQNLLFDYQFGFRSNRSCELAVTYFIDHIKREAKNGKLTGALFIDLSKAFDTVMRILVVYPTGSTKMNLKKGKTEAMLFGTAKRLNILHGAQLETTVNGSTINSTTDYKYLGVYLNSTLNLSTHFDKIYKKADGRVNLLRRIRSSIDMYSVE